MLITGFGVADGVLIGTADGCDEGGGPVGTADAFGPICGFPLKRWASAGSAGSGFFVTGSFDVGTNNSSHVSIPLMMHNEHIV